MLEDIRNHASTPTDEEMEWVATDAIALVMRSVGLAGLAVAIGIAASVVMTPAVADTPLAAAATR